jgi:hypothetical protein
VTFAADAYPLRGLVTRRTVRQRSWSVFAGVPKYARARDGRSGAPEWLAGGAFLTPVGRVHLATSITVAEARLPGERSRRSRTTGVVGTEVFAEMWPDARLFARLHVTDRLKSALQTGAEFRFVTGDLAVELYGFQDGFPEARPLYRPGERGFRVDGSIRANPAWIAFGGLDYVFETSDGRRVPERSRLRGDVGVAWDPAGRFPSIQFSYQRARETFDSRSIARPASVADQIRLRLMRGSASEFLAVSAERVTNDTLGAADRSQLLLDYRRVVGYASVVDGALVVQRMDSEDRGVTAESSVERHLAGPFSWLAGLGVSRVDRAGTTQGEGILRVGFAHRPARRRWHARMELRIPFSIGMERSPLATSALAFDLGTRFRWSDVGTLKRFLVPWADRGRFGAIAGRVLLDGRGLKGLPVLVDGEERARTGSDGSFRVRRVPLGRAAVTLDVRTLDPTYAVLEGFMRDVTVVARGVARADFTVVAMSYFQGSVVTCEDGRRVPLARARLVLRGEDYERAVNASGVGGFLFDTIPPGHYELLVQPAEAARGVPSSGWRFRADLSEEVAGHVLEIGCDDRNEEHDLVRPWKAAEDSF